MRLTRPPLCTCWVHRHFLIHPAATLEEVTYFRHQYLQYLVFEAQDKTAAQSGGSSAAAGGASSGGSVVSGSRSLASSGNESFLLREILPSEEASLAASPSSKPSKPQNAEASSCASRGGSARLHDEIKLF